MDPVTTQTAPAVETVSPCPVCGAYSGATLAQPSALLAVCDVLVVRALESVGKRIVRVDRSRFSRMNGKPWHLAHTIWQPDESMMNKALHGAWDVVPAMLDSHGCCGVTSRQVTAMMDSYVRDLLITGTTHNLSDLRYRFENRLHVTLPEPGNPYVPGVSDG